MTTPSAYRNVSLKELTPLFENLLEVKLSNQKTSELKVYDIIIPLLMMLQSHPVPQENGFEVTGVYMVGSALSHLFASEDEYSDIDLKILIKKTSKVALDAITIFHIFENTPFLSLDGNYKTLWHLASSQTKPVPIPGSYCFKGYTIVGAEKSRPLDISFLVSEDDRLPPSVMNIDSLFIPLKLFCSSNTEKNSTIVNLWGERELGTESIGVFRLYSSQGDIESVLSDIKNRILTSNSLEQIKKFGWARFIIALTEGYISLTSALNQVFQEADMKEANSALYDIYHFVDKKRSKRVPMFWTFFICNALFHASKDEYQEQWANQFISILGWPRQELPWMLFFKQILYPAASRKKILNLLILSLPLFAQSIKIKKHQGKEWIQCEMSHQQKSIYLLLPPLSTVPKEEIEELLPIVHQKMSASMQVKLCIHELQSQDFQPLIIKSILFSLDNALCSMEERQLIHEKIFNRKEEICRFLLEECPDSFSSFEMIQKILAFIDSKEKSKVACMLIRQVLQKFQKELPHFPLSEWEKMIEIANSISTENVPNKLAWKNILLGLTSCLPFEKWNGSHEQFITLGQFIEELVRLSHFSWEKEKSWEENFQVYAWMGLKRWEGEKSARKVILNAPLNNKQLKSLQCLFKRNPLLLPQFIDDLIEENRGGEALTFITTEEDFFYLLQRDPHHVCNYMITRYPNLEERLAAIWDIYSKFHDQDDICTSLEEHYIFRKECKNYLQKKASDEKKELCKHVLLSRLSQHIQILNDAIRLHSTVVLYSDSISKELKRKWGNLFVVHYQKIKDIQLRDKAILFYLPYLSKENLFSLAEKCLLENAIDVFDQICFQISDEKQKKAFILKMLSKETIDLKTLPFHTLLLWLDEFIKQETFPNHLIAQRVDHLVSTFISKLKTEEDTQKCLRAMSEIALSLLIHKETIIVGTPTLAKISQKIMEVLLEERSIEAIETAIKLFNHIHRLRIEKNEVEDLLPDVQALISLVRNGNDQTLLIPVASQALFALLKKIHPHLSADFFKILNDLIRETNRVGRELEFDEENKKKLMEYFIHTYKLCSSYAKIFNNRGIREELVHDAFGALISNVPESSYETVVFQLLEELIEAGIFDGKLIHACVDKLVERYQISYAKAYISIFMSDYFEKVIPWDQLLKMIIPNNVDSWSSSEQELFLSVLSPLIDLQLAYKSHNISRKGLNFRPLLDLYLTLLNNSSIMYISTNLIADFFLSPFAYISQKCKNHDKEYRQFLLRLLELKRTRPYCEVDIKRGKVELFVRNCQETMQHLFPPEEWNEHEQVFSLK